jgi:hypothetical protein
MNQWVSGRLENGRAGAALAFRHRWHDQASAEGESVRHRSLRVDELMAPRRSVANDTLLELTREVGKITAVMERDKEDRSEMRAAFDKFDNGLEALRMGLSALNQTMQSTANQVTNIGLEKCGERLDKIEGTVFSEDFKSSTTRLQRLETSDRAVNEKIARWEGWVGRGWNFFGKVVLAVIASGVVSGTMFGIMSKIAQHI